MNVKRTWWGPQRRGAENGQQIPPPKWAGKFLILRNQRDFVCPLWEEAKGRREVGSVRGRCGTGEPLLARACGFLLRRYSVAVACSRAG